MGSGTYSSSVSFNSSGDKVLLYDKSIRDKKFHGRGIDLDKASRDELFRNKTLDNQMSPFNVKVRESRDSDEHPNSLPVIMGLDVTGSMMGIPHYLVKEGLPNIMGKIIQRGILDPQMLFIGIGDHECDRSPLQIGQFESSDELLDQWLTKVFLEGGGGGNSGESYLLAWYFAAFHTAIDCFEKRKQKGLLFTIGDEPCLTRLPADALQDIMGKGQYASFSHFELLKKAQEKYEVFHIHMAHGSKGWDKRTVDGWKELPGDNLIIVEDEKDTANVIADKIIQFSQKNPAIADKPKNKVKKEEEIVDSQKAEVPNML